MKLGKYKHYKGKLYEVIGVGRLEDNLEEMVIYKMLYDAEDFPKGSIWIRPKKVFEETVEWEGKTVKRFEFVE